MSRWSDVSLTCPQQVVSVVLVEFGERHDKLAKKHEAELSELFL